MVDQHEEGVESVDGRAEQPAEAHGVHGEYVAIDGAGPEHQELHDDEQLDARHHSAALPRVRRIAVTRIENRNSHDRIAAAKRGGQTSQNELALRGYNNPHAVGDDHRLPRL